LEARAISNMGSYDAGKLADRIFLLYIPVLHGPPL
jgi:hypothetical protein